MTSIIVNRFQYQHKLTIILFYFICILYVDLSNGFNNNYKYQYGVYKYRILSMHSSTVMKPADLTPAIDKYVKFPSIEFKESYVLTAKGPAPTGPEPFDLVADDLKPLSDYVKDLVVSENPVLTMAASHFFNQVFLEFMVIVFVLM